MKFKIFSFKSVTSTNEVAIKLIRQEAKISGCVHAEKQTKGKGTHGKRWISRKGNLFLSIFFPLKKNFPTFDEFSIINAIIISGVIKNFCKRKIVNLKFPNDILINGKKVSGILQEIIDLNTKKFLIVGIGINVLSNPDIKNKYKATNILKETQKRLNIIEVMNFITFSYEKFFTNLNSYNYVNFKKKAESMTLN